MNLGGVRADRGRVGIFIILFFGTFPLYKVKRRDLVYMLVGSIFIDPPSLPEEMRREGAGPEEPT